VSHDPGNVKRLTSGSKAPVISFSSVDLPAPFGPTSAMRESCTSQRCRHGADVDNGRYHRSCAQHLVQCWLYSYYVDGMKRLG